ncbi:hypothetical protein CEXT_455171 [Caerostris extrusa]|uniref:Uncharacterized protein n=1 Tax=Caerostris extrusa TaxID=172846 RepID=A0AAV4QHE0_CAEEX|nr:hypothetical protein CEXT_455171 [Caerostris extrusa]
MRPDEGIKPTIRAPRPASISSSLSEAAPCVHSTGVGKGLEPSSDASHALLSAIDRKRGRKWKISDITLLAILTTSSGLLRRQTRFHFLRKENLFYILFPVSTSPHYPFFAADSVYVRDFFGGIFVAFIRQNKSRYGKPPKNFWRGNSLKVRGCPASTQLEWAKELEPSSDASHALLAHRSKQGRKWKISDITLLAILTTRGIKTGTKELTFSFYIFLPVPLKENESPVWKTSQEFLQGEFFEGQRLPCVHSTGVGKGLEPSSDASHALLAHRSKTGKKMENIRYNTFSNPHYVVWITPADSPLFPSQENLF